MTRKAKTKSKKAPSMAQILKRQKKSSMPTSTTPPPAKEQGEHPSTFFGSPEQLRLQGMLPKPIEALQRVCEKLSALQARKTQLKLDQEAVEQEAKAALVDAGLQFYYDGRWYLILERGKEKVKLEEVNPNATKSEIMNMRAEPAAVAADAAASTPTVTPSSPAQGA